MVSDFFLVAYPLKIIQLTLFQSKIIFFLYVAFVVYSLKRSFNETKKALLILAFFQK